MRRSWKGRVVGFCFALAGTVLFWASSVSAQGLPEPQIGAAKRMSATSDGLPETVTIEYVFENLGAGTPVLALSAPEDLTTVFGVHGVDWTFTSISSSPVAFANSGFNGHSDTELLNQAPTQTLTVGATATVTVVLELLTLAAATNGQFCNQVEVTGSCQCSGGTRSDLSTDGADPDPNGDANPDESDPSCLLFEVPPVPAAGSGALLALALALLGAAAWSLRRARA